MTTKEILLGCILGNIVGWSIIFIISYIVVISIHVNTSDVQDCQRESGQVCEQRWVPVESQK